MGGILILLQVFNSPIRKFFLCTILLRKKSWRHIPGRKKKKINKNGSQKKRNSDNNQKHII